QRDDPSPFQLVGCQDGIVCLPILFLEEEHIASVGLWESLPDKSVNDGATGWEPDSSAEALCDDRTARGEQGVAFKNFINEHFELGIDSDLIIGQVRFRADDFTQDNGVTAVHRQSRKPHLPVVNNNGLFAPVGLLYKATNTAVAMVLTLSFQISGLWSVVINQRYCFHIQFG